MRKNIIIKNLASLVPLLSFSALALNGNALNCNEKLNVSVDSCSTLASLVPLLAWAREQIFPSPKTGRKCVSRCCWCWLCVGKDKQSNIIIAK